MEYADFTLGLGFRRVGCFCIEDYGSGCLILLNTSMIMKLNQDILNL